jgi:hypothetical protein
MHGMIIEEKPSMCWRCGYQMNGCTDTNRLTPRAPREEDISMCLNCGALYTRHDDAWKPATSGEIEALDEGDRRKLLKMLITRRFTITTDLSKKGGGHA